MEKADILKNALDVARHLGIVRPKAACLSKMAERQVSGDAVVDGPLAIDNILSAEAGRKKGIVSEVAGQADIVPAPSIETANVFAKTLNYLLHSSNAGIVMGMSAPVILSLRASDPKSKYASLALGVLVSKK